MKDLIGGAWDDIRPHVEDSLRNGDFAMDILDRLIDREIDVYVGGVLVKTIRRHVRRPDCYKPARGIVEVQKREWVKVHAISPAPHPRWRLDVEENKWLDAQATIKR